MHIWIDLANSPQVLFFRPIIAVMERMGHKVIITSRDFAQTVALAHRYGFRHTPIGVHGGKRWLNIFRHTIGRSLQLAQWARRQGRIDLIVSHNSYSQAVAARLLRRPFVTLMDYEHQPFNHICFRLARRVIVPEPFPDADLRRYGGLSRAVKFPGLKEQVYLDDFQPTPDFLASQGIPGDKIVIAMRPPAPWAAYHRQFENTLFDDVLTTLARHQNTFIVFTPRIPAQGAAIRALGLSNILVPPRALDGPNLLYHADLVISGGGTMNREGAVLGTPVYTVFTGRLGAVDRYLIDRGRMVHIGECGDIPSIRVEKRVGDHITMLEPGLVDKVTSAILSG